MICSGVPLKMFWVYSIWENHAHARYLRKFLTKKVTAYILAHSIDQKWSSVWFFLVGFFPKFLNFLEHVRGRFFFLGLQLRQNWSVFSRTFFDEEIASFLNIKARSRRYLARTITDADYADDIALLANTHARPKSCCIVWNGQQVAYASIWTQTKRSTYALIKRVTSHKTVVLWN